MHTPLQVTACSTADEHHQSTIQKADKLQYERHHPGTKAGTKAEQAAAAVQQQQRRPKLDWRRSSSIAEQQEDTAAAGATTTMEDSRARPCSST
jgi:hypothetical protein